MELLVARNPDPESTLPYLLWVPLADGLVFRTKGTWPTTTALYCYPVPSTDWPEVPELVERVPLRACTRRGASIDLVADRSRLQRSQLVFTNARGRQAVFWQSPRTRKQARPDVRLPSARASGVAELEIIVDAHEHYPFRLTGQQVRTVRRGLTCGDYAVTSGGRVIAAVERKSLDDLVSSLTTGRLRFALGELAALPRAAVVVEDRYSKVFALTHSRPAVVADGLADLQVRWQAIPIVFCENRQLAEQWTYRYLAAAYAMGRDRAGVPRPDRRRRGRDGGRSPTTGALHRRGPGVGSRQRPHRARPRPPAPRDPPGLVRRPPALIGGLAARPRYSPTSQNVLNIRGPGPAPTTGRGS